MASAVGGEGGGGGRGRGGGKGEGEREGEGEGEGGRFSMKSREQCFVQDFQLPAPLISSNPCK